MKILRALLLLSILFAAGQSRSQAIIRIDSASLFAMQDTFTLGQTVSDSVFIYNDGSADYFDTLSFRYSINGANYIDTNSFSGLDFTLDSVFIPAGGHIAKSIFFHFTVPRFAIGSSVVVIWPVVGPSAVLDQAKVTKNFYLWSPASINDPELEKVKAYVNDRQLIINCEAQNELRRVIIFDVRGALLLSTEATGNTTIPLYQLSSGIYFAEVILADDRRQVFKIFIGQ